MTVITYKDGVMACDGIRTDHNSCIVDFAAEKIQRINGWLIGTAGDSTAGDQFKLWFGDTCKLGRLEKPPESILLNGAEHKSSLTVLMVNCKSKEVYYMSEASFPVKLHKPFHAIGSGSEVAIGAMAMSADAVQAIKVVSKHISGIGGKIRSLKVDA